MLAMGEVGIDYLGDYQLMLPEVYLIPLRETRWAASLSILTLLLGFASGTNGFPLHRLRRIWRRFWSPTEWGGDEERGRASRGQRDNRNQTYPA